MFFLHSLHSIMVQLKAVFIISCWSWQSKDFDLFNREATNDFPLLSNGKRCISAPWVVFHDDHFYSNFTTTGLGSQNVQPCASNQCICFSNEQKGYGDVMVVTG